MPSNSEAILSSHKDAARRVLDYLQSQHNLNLKPTVAHEIVARVLGAADWQTLQGMAKEGRVPRMADLAAGTEQTPVQRMQSLVKDLEAATEDALAESRAVTGLSSPGPAGRLNPWHFQRDLNVARRRLPSKDWVTPGFIWEFSSAGFTSTNSTGKWCIFRDADNVDALWEKVQRGVRQGQFAAALVSSAAQAASREGRHVICAFTWNWADREDVMRAWQALRDMGVTEELGYKRDIETMKNVYGVPEEWYYRA